MKWLDIVEKKLKEILSEEQTDNFMKELKTSLDNRCGHIMNRGKRIGKACERKCPGNDLCKIHSEIDEKDMCTYILKTKKRCKKSIETNGLCKKHLNEAKLKGTEEGNVEEMTEEVTEDDVKVTVEEVTEEEEITEKVTNTNNIPYLEYGSDDDEDIDTSDLTELYDIHKSWGCQYWDKTENFFCEKDTVISNQFCEIHKNRVGKAKYIIRPHTYPLLEIDTVYYKIHEFTGQYWFPNLLLTAKPHTDGLVVVARLLGQRWFKTLERREIKRCQNNGLLYKVIPQEILHKNYHIPSLETINSEGYTSFEEIRRHRPKMYIKYWKIWNLHIRNRRDFILKNEKTKDVIKWQKLHNCPLPNWKELKEIFKIRGLENLIIPPPDLEELQDEKWDPWHYCDNWVSSNLGETISPYFPPMYLDMPNPYVLRTNNTIQFKEKQVNLNSPRRVRHYKHDSKDWLHLIVDKKREWNRWDS